jgi:biotin operon repressor
MNAQNRVFTYLNEHRGKPQTVCQISDACGIQHNTTTKEIKHLRDQGIEIRDNFVDGKNYKEYWLTSKVWRQSNTPCVCGSYYRIGRFCNRCSRPDDI